MLLFIYQGKYLMSDLDNLLEEHIKQEMLLYNVPIANMLDKFVHTWTLLNNGIQYLSFLFHK